MPTESNVTGAGLPSVATEEVPLIEVRNLSKDFGGLRAIAAVSFRVHEGEILGVIGPNGAGKTTLFGLLSGFLPPTTGEIYFQGVSLHHYPPDRRCHLGLARTFQIVRPFPEMTVLENIKVAAVFGKPDRRNSRQIKDEVDRILATTGLTPAAHLHPPSLSLPQRKRLEVARALATQPKILLLDEVLAGLNPSEVRDAIPFIRSLNTQQGMTILMIEHNLKAIMGLSHRILVLNFGRLIFDGQPVVAVKDPEVIQAYLGGTSYA